MNTIGGGSRENASSTTRVYYVCMYVELYVCICPVSVYSTRRAYQVKLCLFLRFSGDDVFRVCIHLFVRFYMKFTLYGCTHREFYTTTRTFQIVRSIYIM